MGGISVQSNPAFYVVVVVDFEEKRVLLSDCLVVRGWQRPFNSLVEI